MRQRSTRHAWDIVTVCAVGLAARILFATLLVPYFEQRAHVAADPDHYVELAASLLDHRTLGFSPPGASPTTVRGPAFPTWLAAGMFVGGRSERWIALWASLPGLIAAAALVAALGRSHGRAAGLVGGLLAAAHPLSCFVSARTLPDEFYGAALLLALLAWQRPGPSWAAGSALLLSAAALTRATALLLLILIVALYVLSKPRRLLAGAVVALVAMCVLGAWTFRTSSLLGRPAFIESLAGYNFWLGEAADRFGFAADFGEAKERAHALMADEAGTPETRDPSFVYVTLQPRKARDFDDRLKSAALRRIAARPVAYAKRFVAGLLWFWVRAETASRTIQYAVVVAPLLALGLYGLRRPAVYTRPGALPLALVLTVIGIHVVIYAAVCPMARYSVQVYPLLCYLVGAGCSTRQAEFF